MAIKTTRIKTKIKEPIQTKLYSGKESEKVPYLWEGLESEGQQSDTGSLSFVLRGVEWKVTEEKKESYNFHKGSKE